MRDYRLKVLGLCAMVLGLMAVGTGSAQAEPTAHWNVNGAAISSGLLPFVQVKEVEVLNDEKDPGRHLVLLSKIAGAAFKILCENAELEEFHFLIEGKSLGKIKFTGCKIYLNGVLSKPCEPKTGAEAGVILTNLLKDLIVLHKLASGEVDDLDRLEPNEGETFVSISTSAECSVGEKIPVKGKFFIKDCLGKFLVEEVTHLIEEGPLTHLFVISDTAEHASVIEGSAILELAGAHKGLKWSGTPG